LGLNSRVLTSDRLQNQILRKLDSELDLVMILEHFEESLILLKHSLCWNDDDLSYVKVNENAAKWPELSGRMSSKLKNMLKYEYELYDFFKQKLQEKILSFGASKIKSEKRLFAQIRLSVESKCQEHCLQGKPQCKIIKHLRKLTNCPCEKFSFCVNCQAMKLTSPYLNLWANCIQEKRLSLS